MHNKKRILIVEFCPALAQLWKACFEKRGFEVDITSDGLTGLTKAREGVTDLIILNPMLPRLDGYHICRFLKFDRKYKHIPVIMVSAKKQENEKQIGTESGANEYIFNSFDINKLITTVQKYLV